MNPRSILPILILMLVVAGCSREAASPPPSAPLEEWSASGTREMLPRTSPENLIQNLLACYDERNLVAYDSLLANDFEFSFLPDGSTLPEIMDAVEEHHAHENLFDPEWVSSLFLDVTCGEVTVDSTHWDGDQYWRTAILSEVHLSLRGRTPQHPEEPPRRMKVAHVTEQLWFRENPWTDPETGEPIWTITRWEEVVHATDPTWRDTPVTLGVWPYYTWAEVKTLYR